MTPAQQATAELHAAFWNISYTDTLVAMRSVTQTLPARRYDMMKNEVNELKDLGMQRLGKGATR